jgi:polar amino acid transport system substrate-binding protein
LFDIKAITNYINNYDNKNRKRPESQSSRNMEEEMHKRNFAVIALIFFLITAFSTSLFAQTVELAVDDSNPPFMYKNNATNAAAGLYPEMAKVFFKEIGVDVTVTPYPWKRTLQLSEEGRFGVIGIYINADRLKIYDYSEPIFGEKIVIYTQSDKSFSFKTVADLKGKKIGVLRGWSYGDDFDAARKQGDFTAEDNTSDEANLKKLQKGRLDCLVAIQESGDSLIKKFNMADKVTKLDPPLVVNSTYIVFPKSAKLQDILDKINVTVARMKQDGSYNTMVEEIFSDEGNK